MSGSRACFTCGFPGEGWGPAAQGDAAMRSASQSPFYNWAPAFAGEALEAAGQ